MFSNTRLSPPSQNLLYHQYEISIRVELSPRDQSPLPAFCPFKIKLPDACRPDRIALSPQFEPRPAGYNWKESQPVAGGQRFDIPVSKIHRVDFATQYLGAAYILSFGHTFDQVPAMSRGTRITFDAQVFEYVYQLTRIRHSFCSHAHVEAVAFNDRGHYHTEASSTYPPIILTIPHDRIVHETFI